MAPYIFVLVIALGTIGTVTVVSEPANVPPEKQPGIRDDKEPLRIHTGKPTEGFLSKRPTMKELQRIKWDGKKELMLIETIAAHWRNLGTTLGIPEAVLNGYATKHMKDQEECCREVLQRWLERGSEPKESYPVNWEGLISALEDTGLNVIADDMRQMMTTIVPETKHATTIGIQLKSEMSSTTAVHHKFVSEPMHEKSVTELAGIGPALGRRLSEKGFDKAYVVLGQFFVLKRNEQMFKVWLQETCGANVKQQDDCYKCLKEWCEQHFD